MPDTNSALWQFLLTYYAASLPDDPDLTSLVTRYLDENPDSIADRTARFQKLIADAEAA